MACGLVWGVPLANFAEFGYPGGVCGRGVALVQEVVLWLGLWVAGVLRCVYARARVVGGLCVGACCAGFWCWCWVFGLLGWWCGCWGGVVGCWSVLAWAEWPLSLSWPGDLALS